MEIKQAEFSLSAPMVTMCLSYIEQINKSLKEG